MGTRPSFRVLLPLLALALVASGCSVRRMALVGLADSLSGGAGSVFGSDDDPELIRDAAPFSLKTIEALLVELPEHPGLLLAACSGFAQYAYAFPQTDADLVGDGDYARVEGLRTRARKLYVRGRDYCLRALEQRHPGVGERLLLAPEDALGWAGAADVPLLYWTGAAWGGAIALGLDRPELVADLPAVRALLERALALDGDWERGAIHAALISLDAVPDAMGGSRERARRHFERAVELSGGDSAAPYVSYAVGVAQPDGDRAGFERLLGQALAVDPDRDPSQRLANLVVQRRARHLLDRTDALFPGAQAEGNAP
jgi:predicted anti-sigma-YlaC factor YlaD